MEAPSTLAESLLDDLDELASDNEESAEINDNERGAKSTSNSSLPLPLPLLNDVTLQNHLRDIRASDALKNLNNKEHDEQDYNLIVKSNKQLSRIADELTRAHGELCLAYNPKFPELEELIPNPVQYKNAVSVIRTEMDISLVSDALNDILNSNQVLTVSVSGSMTSGRPLTMTELERVDRAIRYMDDILKLQRELSLFVERRMERLAPNAVTLIGAPLAAQLLGMAGGLEELSKIPSCNLQVMGQTKQTSSSRGGMSSSTTRPNEGLLVQCELVQQCPKSLQHKALKMVAAKTALAVRCDFVNQSTDASAGLSFRRQIEATFSKLLQPDKAPTLKSLPK
jgi:U4/U6 small nuclear ribonucleoprotein PRP31